jgi:predicted Zn-dependent peptidase
MPGQRSISMGLLVEAGPRNETSGKTGLAHLAEHAMFCGTSGRDATQIARMMDEAGGHMGAFTARDYTGYYATVLDDYLPYALDLMGDTLLNSIFPPDSLEKEKIAILREIETACDMPAACSHDLLKALAWPGHPLGRSITGRPETVRSLTRDDVIYFVHEHYLPDRLVIAAAGNVDHEDFVAQVRDAFWRMMGQSLPESINLPAYQPGMAIRHMPVSQYYFSMGIRAPRYSDPNRYGMHILNNILGGGISSRLYRRVREKHGIVYHIGSEYHAYHEDGMLVVEGCTAPENILQVLSMVVEEVAKLISGIEQIDEEELWKAKMQIRGQHLISGENTNTRMNRLAAQELYFSRQIPDEEILAAIETISIHKLQSFAENALGEALSQTAIAVVGPQAPDRLKSLTIDKLLGSYH